MGAAVLVAPEVALGWDKRAATGVAGRTGQNWTADRVTSSIGSVDGVRAWEANGPSGLI